MGFHVSLGECKPPLFKDLNIRIPIIPPVKGRGSLIRVWMKGYRQLTPESLRLKVLGSGLTACAIMKHYSEY